MPLGSGKNTMSFKVKELEAVKPELKNSFKSWPKDRHLQNIQSSGEFQYVREVVFSNSEECDAERFVALALCQGGLQSVLKAGISEIEPFLNRFKESVNSIFREDKITIDFCYRMRIGVK